MSGDLFGKWRDLFFMSADLFFMSADLFFMSGDLFFISGDFFFGTLERTFTYGKQKQNSFDRSLLQNNWFLYLFQIQGFWGRWGICHFLGISRNILDFANFHRFWGISFTKPSLRIPHLPLYGGCKVPFSMSSVTINEWIVFHPYYVFPYFQQPSFQYHLCMR